MPPLPAGATAASAVTVTETVAELLKIGDGEVTRDSFTEAAKGMTEGFGTGGMTGDVWIFGPGDSHQPNAAAWPLAIEANSGEWTSLGPWFIGTDNGWVNTAVPND